MVELLLAEAVTIPLPIPESVVTRMLASVLLLGLSWKFLRKTGLWGIVEGGAGMVYGWFTGWLR